MILSAYYAGRILDSIDEIQINYNRMGDIYDYLKEHPKDKRVCILAPPETEVEKLMSQLEYIKALECDYTVACKTIPLLYHLLQSNVVAFLNYPVTDWETFENLKQMGVSDILIDGPLGFSLTEVIVGKGDMKIRAIPSASPNAALSKGDNLNTFFIRPEDIPAYEGSIDIFDFHAEGSTTDREHTLVEKYKSGMWVGSLDTLIKGIVAPISNVAIRPEFADSRLDCRQVCKIPGRVCHKCQHELQFSEALLNYVKEDKE